MMRDVTTEDGFDAIECARVDNNTRSAAFFFGGLKHKEDITLGRRFRPSARGA